MGIVFRGERLEQLRKQRGITQTTLGEMLDITQRQVSKYERGGGNPSVEVLVKLADILDTSTDYLLGITHTPDKHAFDDIPELQYEVLQLIHAEDETFLRKLIVVLKVLREG